MSNFVSIVVAVAALVVSLAGFVHQRSSVRRELMVRVYADFLGEEQQEGRRKLFTAHAAGRTVTDLSDDEWRTINHAVGALNLIGYLHYRRAIPRIDVLQLVGVTVQRAFEACTDIGLFEARDRQQGALAWPHFRYLAREVTRGKDQLTALRDS